MRSKESLIALGVRVSALSLLFFASFTASLYLPHQSPWWRAAMIVLIVMSGVSAVRGYLRRIEVRNQNPKISGKIWGEHDGRKICWNAEEAATHVNQNYADRLGL